MGYPITNILNIVELQGLGLKLGIDFTFAWDNHNNENHNHNNPHLNFLERNSTFGQGTKV